MLSGLRSVVLRDGDEVIAVTSVSSMTVLLLSVKVLLTMVVVLINDGVAVANGGGGAGGSLCAANRLLNPLINPRRVMFRGRVFTSAVMA